MSLDLSKRVWRSSRSRGVARLVLLGLADFADDHGYCFPGQRRLANMCNTSVRSVYAALKQLQALGEVVIVPYQSRHGGHAYHITLSEESSTVEETSGRQGGDLGRPEDSDTTTGSSCTATGRFTLNDRNTSSDNPSEPSVNHHEPSGAQVLASPQERKREIPVPMPEDFWQRSKPTTESQSGNGSAKVQTPTEVTT